MASSLQSDVCGSAGAAASPLVRELRPAPDPVEALRKFADLDGVLLLHSASRRPGLGRYSFLTADPPRRFRLERAGFGVDPFAGISEALRPFAGRSVPGLPPFQGGAAGLLGYDLGEAWERFRSRPRRSPTPALAVGVYDWVIAWDHEREAAWVVSHGYPELDAGARADRAAARLETVLERLNGPPRPARSGVVEGRGIRGGGYEMPPRPQLSSTFTRDEYVEAVARVVEYIRAGDAFQVNLSQQLSARLEGSAVDFYARLAAANPAPFAGYFAADDWAVVSASPERLFRVRDGQVETRPIKGTRPRSADAAEDERLAAELRASEKDRAENVMIVDLLRNDLSRVCRPGSVRVERLCGLETYETVHHLVSTVTGTLDPGRTAWDLFAAGFPGGSITGAPKVRAMQIIDELEPAARGAYCGSLFYVGFDGAADSNLLIRSATVQGGEVRFGVGGGVTAASDPQAEYEETLHKAAGMLPALEGGMTAAQ